jgi:hypothetical protein
MKSLITTLATAALFGAAATAETLKSFRPGGIWPDTNGVHINAHGGGVLFHEGTYYWFGEHKVEGGAGNTAQVGVGVYSSNDLYNWKNEGIALPVSDDSASEIVKGNIIERPKVLFNKKTGKFAMWFHLELPGQGYRAARSGVAVADKVTGPYTYLGSFRPNAGVWPENFPEDLRKPLSDEERQKLAATPMPGDSVPEWARDMVVRRDSYLWYRGGDAVGVYDFNWKPVGTLPVVSKDFVAPQGDMDIRIGAPGMDPSVWFECQFFVKDSPLSVSSSQPR